MSWAEAERIADQLAKQEAPGEDPGADPRPEPEPLVLTTTLEEARHALAVASADLLDAKARRDAAIRAMRDHGATLRDIAVVAGITAPGVADILRRV